MKERTKTCPVCGAEAHFSAGYDRSRVFYGCPVCGRFDLGAQDNAEKINYNHLSSYLLYHRFECTDFEYRYHTTLGKDICDQYKQEREQGTGTRHPVHMDAEIIENWYPRTFAERIDKILLYINAHTPHIGQQITLRQQELLGMLFVDRFENEQYLDCPHNRKPVPRNEDDCEREAKYMLDYLARCAYIEYTEGPSIEEAVDLFLTPDGYFRVDILQKNTSYGRNVLIAMKFGDDTLALREAIRKGVKSAGYNPIFIDEVQHLNFITPELLRYIRDSKFVVVDLTHQNNGVYFEEGYAMGLGKPVIQLCQKDQKLHFDIAQKNTIMWETENDIPERLHNRIKATID